MISVIIPIYKKTLGLIERCFNSVINQTYKDLEVLILYDDFNDDKNKIFVENYCKQNNWKFIYSLVRTSPYSARYNGMKNMKGDYLFIIDADDFIDNDYLENLLNEIKNNDIIIGHEIFYHLNGTSHKTLDPFNGTFDIKKFFPYFRGLITKNIIQIYLQKNKNIFLSQMEDYYLMFQIYSLTDKITFLKADSYYHYNPQIDSSTVIIFNKLYKYLFDRCFCVKFVAQKLKEFDLSKWEKYELDLLKNNLISTKTSQEERVYVLKMINQDYDINKIPRYIHYIWIGDKLEPDKIKTFNINKDYIIIKRNGEEIQNHPWVKSCIENKKYSLASDYIRLWYLYNYGGWYFDTDNNCIKDLSDDFTDKDFVIGWENDNLILGFNVIGCKVHDKYIKILLDWYEDKVYSEELNKPFEMEDLNGKKYLIGGNFTINKIGTKLLLPYIKSGEIKPYSNEYFIAGHYMPNTPYKITNKTYIEHIYKKQTWEIKDFGFC